MKKPKKRAGRKEYPAIRQFKGFENPKDSNKLIDNLWDVVLVTSSEGRILYANNAVKKYGFSRKGVVGKMMYGFIPRKYWHTITKYHAQLLKGKAICGETKIITKKKRVAVCEYATSPIRKKGKIVAFQTILRDITERKEAEKSVKESKEKYKFIVDNSREIILIINKVGKIVFANKSTLKTIGYSKEEVIGKPFKYFLTKDSVKKALYSIKQDFLGNSKKIELKVKTKSGEIRYLEFAKEVGFIREKWKVTSILVTANDITERKKAEEKIIESERKYRATFENTGTAMMIIEEDTTISLVNRQMEKLTGYSEEEIEGRMSWTEFVLKEDLEMMKKYHNERRKLKSNVPNQYEFRLVDRNGNIKNMFITISIIPGTKKSIASLMDVTERKKAEEELRERNEELEKFNKFVVGRELKMVELKKEINELLRKAGEKAKYDVNLVWKK